MWRAGTVVEVASTTERQSHGIHGLLRGAYGSARQGLNDLGQAGGIISPGVRPVSSCDACPVTGARFAAKQSVKAITQRLAPTERMPSRTHSGLRAPGASRDIGGQHGELQLHGFVKRSHGLPRVAKGLHSPNEALTKRCWVGRVGWSRPACPPKLFSPGAWSRRCRGAIREIRNIRAIAVHLFDPRMPRRAGKPRLTSAPAPRHSPDAIGAECLTIASAKSACLQSTCSCPP